MAIDDEALAQFSRHRDELFAKIRQGSLKEVLALGCPVCGAAMVICWMRQLVPLVGRDALNVRCNDDRCAFSIQADGKITRPAWAGFFSGTLTTTPAMIARPRIAAGDR